MNPIVQLYVIQGQGIGIYAFAPIVGGFEERNEQTFPLHCRPADRVQLPEGAEIVNRNYQGIVVRWNLNGQPMELLAHQVYGYAAGEQHGFKFMN